jgi:hypothetical protein
VSSAVSTLRPQPTIPSVVAFARSILPRTCGLYDCAHRRILRPRRTWAPMPNWMRFSRMGWACFRFLRRVRAGRRRAYRERWRSCERGKPGGSILLHFDLALHSACCRDKRSRNERFPRCAGAGASRNSSHGATLSAMPSPAHPCVTGTAMRGSHSNVARDASPLNEDPARHAAVLRRTSGHCPGRAESATPRSRRQR